MGLADELLSLLESKLYFIYKSVKKKVSYWDGHKWTENQSSAKKYHSESEAEKACLDTGDDYAEIDFEAPIVPLDIKIGKTYSDDELESAGWRCYRFTGKNGAEWRTKSGSSIFTKGVIGKDPSKPYTGWTVNTYHK